jgi:hypothetical protein
MYPVTPLGPQYIWYVDYVTICPDSCNSTIYYNNNDILPVGDSKYGYIYAGSTAGSGTSGLVTVSPTGTSNLIAAHEIQLLPEFEAIVTTGGFIASIRPCDTSGGETRLNHEINKAADRNIPVPLFRDYPDPPINNITDNSNARVQGQVAIYPNPAKDKLQGRLIGNDEKTVTIKILDCYGKLMKTTTLNNINKGSQNFEINISDLPAGLYFIHISGKRSSVVKKFEKIK